MSSRPFEEELSLAVEFKIASIVNGKYVYSPEFEESVEELRRHPPGRIAQIRMGKKIKKSVVRALIGRAKYFKSKLAIENLVTAYVCVKVHLKRLNLSMPEDKLPGVIYATYHLNDNEPEVWEDV